MASNASSDTTSLPSTSDLPILRLNSTPGSLETDESNLDFAEESSGLVLLRKEELESFLSTRRMQAMHLNSAIRQIMDLEQQLSSERKIPSTVPSAYENQMQAFVTLTMRNCEKEEELKTTLEQLRASQQEVKDLKAELEAFNYDWDELLASHKNYKAQAKLATAYKHLFKEKISEVYLAQSELREPFLHPKMPKGCINCGQQGHSQYTCKEEYSGEFCQKCSAQGFNTKDCPWPHFAEGVPKVPDSQKCRRCRQPKNKPDPNCPICRDKIIAQNKTKRYDLAVKLKQESLAQLSNYSTPKLHDAPRPQQDKVPVARPTEQPSISLPVPPSAEQPPSRDKTPPLKPITMNSPSSDDDAESSDTSSTGQATRRG
ncbi:uncharacterized protein LOC122506763 [Leptopilina heterotoma]|uniref:uncharacterized protein LOC122506763 n=1 Tax=Leptopilina heterotoma TaxID=63436 RepID=UPI001CA89B2E|nr:uncharacterized protein LOC122506763 [Leptopilina heterotoma]